MKGKIIFEEEQTFRYKWAWWLTIFAILPTVFTFCKGFYQQIILGEKWGDQPMSDAALIVFFAVMLAICFGVFFMIDRHRLSLKIDEATIAYKFVPYFRSFRKADKNQLKEAYVRKYTPILEYGGWGRRGLWGKNKAYNISGNWGLQLVFQDGTKLLIGTQKHEELERAMALLKTNWKND